MFVIEPEQQGTIFKNNLGFKGSRGDTGPESFSVPSTTTQLVSRLLHSRPKFQNFVEKAFVVANTPT